MPSASLRSRIQAFEALSSSSSSSSPASNLLESPISPSASAFHPIVPAPASSSRSRSPSPCQSSLIDLKDWIVADGPVEHPQSTPPRAGVRKLNGIHGSSTQTASPLISFEPPSKPRPPLPPRKPSFNAAPDRASTQSSPHAGCGATATLRLPGRSDALTIEHTYPPGAHKFGAGRIGHAPASSISSFHSVSLSSDGSHLEVHSPKISSKPPSFSFEVDSSIGDFDTASIAESFENVSAPSAHSPSTVIPFDWEQAINNAKTSPKLEPPSLPNRAGVKTAPPVPPKPLVRSVSTSSSSTATSTKTRRPPPPPPPYQPRSRPSSSRASVVSTSASTSDRSSILSNTTRTSRTSTSTRNSTQVGSSTKSSPLLRPTPVPPPARSRYESLFDSAVKGRRVAEQKRPKTGLAPPLLPAKKGGQAAGWRDLSVDLITDPEDHPVQSLEGRIMECDSEEEPPVGPDEKLNGRIVKYIWSASRLDRKKLGSIWNECDTHGAGFIDRDAFVKGMWRIDEELRRVQLARRTLALTAASSQRMPHRPLPPPRLRDATRLLI